MTPENDNLKSSSEKGERTPPRWVIVSGAAAALAAGAVGFAMVGGNVRDDLPDGINLRDRVNISEASEPAPSLVDVAPAPVLSVSSDDSPFDSVDSPDAPGVPAPAPESFDSLDDSPANSAPAPSFDSPDDSPVINSQPAPTFSNQDQSVSFDSSSSISYDSPDDSVSFDSVDDSD